MTTIKVYGVSCESSELASQLQVILQHHCHTTGPAAWRMKDFTSQQARAQAKREGWKRVPHHGKYGTVMYDVCRTCYPQLADALEKNQFEARVKAHAEQVSGRLEAVQS